MGIPFILEKIRLARTAKKISQQEVADYLYITQSSYAKIERGESRLGLDHFLKIADYLGIDLPLLFGNSPSTSFLNDDRLAVNGTAIREHLSYYQQEFMELKQMVAEMREK